MIFLLIPVLLTPAVIAMTPVPAVVIIHSIMQQIVPATIPADVV